MLHNKDDVKGDALMPPKPRFTREDIVNAALDIIRERDIEHITAQAIAKKLHTSTRPMFNYFSTLEELRTAAAEQARLLYNEYAEKGLAMTPAFKGFAMSYIKFAIEEPSLFRLLFMRKTENADMFAFLDNEGHLNTVLEAISETFGLDSEKSMWLYGNMWLYAHGIATVCASETMRFSDEDIAQRLGLLCRSLLISMNFPNDERTGVVPKNDFEMPGKVEDYFFKSQNRS